MRPGLKLFLWVGVVACLALVAVVGSGLWLLPRLVHTEALKSRMLAEVSRRTGAPVEAGRIDLELWPAPHVSFQSVRFTRGPNDLKAASAEIDLSLAHLLKGLVQINAVRLNGVRATLRIPEVPFAEEEWGPITLARVEESLSRGLSALYRSAHDLSLTVRGGSADLSDGKATHFRLDGVEARIRTDPRRFSFSSSFSTPKGEKVSLEGALDPEGWRGTSRLTATGLRSKELLQYLFPRISRAAVDAVVSGNLTLAVEGRGRVTAVVECATPLVVLPPAGKALSLQGVSGKGKVSASQDGWRLTVDSLLLDAPRLDLAGTATWDSRARKAKAEFRGREADAGALLRAASRLAPAVEGLRIAQDVVRSGTVRGVTFASQGGSPGALLSVDAAELRGTARDVSLHIPGVAIDVTGGAGDVSFSQGVLRGAKLSGKTHGGVARDGSLRLALFENNPPFHLALDVSAGLPEVVALLRRLLPPGDFARELARVHGVAGTAEGRLTLGERLKNLTVQVDASAVDASGSYDRFPFPLALRATRFVVRRNEVSAEGVTGTAGRSRLQGVSAAVGWGREPALRIASASGRLDLSELFPWLLSFPGARAMFRDIGPPAGFLSVEKLSLAGPFLRPTAWRFRLDGGLEGIALRSVLFPDVLRVARARLEATEQDVTYRDATVTHLDAVLVGDARIERYREEHPALDVTFRGRLGRRATDWISGRIDLPPELHVLRPLEVLRGRMTRSASGGVTYSGDHLAEAGPEVGVAVRRTGAKWAVDRLDLRDGASNVRMTLNPTPNGYEVGLKGRLRNTTLDALLGKNPYLRGVLEGDFRARVDTRNLLRSSFVGWARGSDLEILRTRGLPLSLEEASVRGDGKGVQVDSARFTFGSQRFGLAGRLEAGADAVNTDLTLSGREVDGTVLLQEMNAALGTLRPSSGDTDELQGFWKFPARGRVKTNLASLRFGRMAIAPFAVDVSLAPGRLTADGSRLGVCGIALPSRLEATPERATLRMEARANGADLRETLTCLGHESGLMTGALEIKADLSATGTLAQPRRLLQSLQGEIFFKAKEGRIFRMGVLAKIFAVLNVTELLRGRLPDLFEQGFGYRRIRSDATLADGKLTFQEGVVDGASMTLLWDGTIDLSNRETDLTVIVAPLKTVDAIVSRIPVVNYLLDRTLLSIPVRVTGDLADPSIVALSPTAVGRRILGLLERTLRLPYKLIQPLLPKEAEKKAP